MRRLAVRIAVQVGVVERLMVLPRLLRTRLSAGVLKSEFPEPVESDGGKSIYSTNLYSVGPSIRPIRTRCCLAISRSRCSNFH